MWRASTLPGTAWGEAYGPRGVLLASTRPRSLIEGVFRSVDRRSGIQRLDGPADARPPCQGAQLTGLAFVAHGACRGCWRERGRYSGPASAPRGLVLPPRC